MFADRFCYRNNAKFYIVQQSTIRFDAEFCIPNRNMTESHDRIGWMFAERYYGRKILFRLVLVLYRKNLSYKKNSFIYIRYGVNLASYANIDLSYANLHKLSLQNSDYSCLFIVCLFVYYIYLILYGLKYFFFQSIVFFQGIFSKPFLSKPPKKRREKTYYNKFKQPVTQIFIIIKILVRIHLNYLRKLTQT